MDSAIPSIKKHFRAANYLSAAQIYLQNNFLLKWQLTSDDIKPRLLGHWGTCPGINFVYANLNYLIKKYNQEMLFVVGPGHGFPAVQANLFIEGTLGKYYHDASQDSAGISYICKNFSWPYGFPSHSNPGTPGVILEGGELGYCLSTAYGTILDNPDLITACLIGDGEAETGPLAASWHINKFINPENNGAVLPILHLNGYKISGPTIFGRMSEDELRKLFEGYGYEPLFVTQTDDKKSLAGDQIFSNMIETLDLAYQKIKHIQKKSREGKKIISPKYPMIILRTPKGWTGIDELDGKKLEGNNLSHQVIAADAKTNKDHLSAIENWLHSYDFNSLFDPEKGFCEEIKELIPEEELRLGNSKYVYPESVRKELLLPFVETFTEDVTEPGIIGSSNMRRAGGYLNGVFLLNDDTKNFRLFSPDETYSNKLDEVFRTTSRAFVWPTESWDKDISHSGRVIEMLSEHSLQGLLQGYILTGRHGVFATYEAFVQIVVSMADQYSKFLKASKEIPWRKDVSSLNYILTSSGWRQDHNGFSHQNPGFVSELLEKDEDFINFYFPADGNTTLVVLEKALRSKNGINIITAGKTLEPRWLNIEQARKQVEDGVMIWDFASEEDPDIVLCGIGDYVTKEVLAAISCIKEDLPEIKVRFVNIVDLKKLRDCDFENYFTTDKPVLFNFHGYPMSIKKLLFDRSDTERLYIHGYTENGSTTTPFDMHVRNQTSRWHLALECYSIFADQNKIPLEKLMELNQKYAQKFEDHKKYIIEYGIDPKEIEDWQWKGV